MGTDRNFFFDFQSEIPLKNWSILQSEPGCVTVKCQPAERPGDYIFLAPCPPEGFDTPRLKTLSVNGQEFLPEKSNAMYVHEYYIRYGIPISLQTGVNEIVVRFTLPENIPFDIQNLPFSLLKPEAAPIPIKTEHKLHPFPKESYRRNTASISTDGWQLGAGGTGSPGRFGFSKGDGLLDCAMPSLGLVDKMFLCGQPKYRKPYRWSYSVRPEGMPIHGSFEPRETGIEQDDIRVNSLSVCWAARHNGARFSCSYSLASPAILTESESGKMFLSGLRFAGNYQSVLIPRADGIEETDLDSCSIQNMAENWILLFNSTEFPDVPIMLLFDRNPEGMDMARDADGRLRSITFTGCPLMFSCTPFGIQRFDRGGMPVEEAIRRCRFWSRALLAYPVSQTDYFTLNEQQETVTIRQKFEYRYITDAWNTEPLELAPLPPPVSLCKTAHCPDATDFSFPTKYGWLRGRIGTWSEYTLPFMPIHRKFPLRDEHSEILDLLRRGMAPYQKLVSAFGPDKVSYPYAGAILEPFALASTLSLFMNETDRTFLRDNLKERVCLALQENKQSDYTVISWGQIMALQPDHDTVIDIYNDPEKKHIFLRNWYTRIEPFTGASFKICYLNVGFFSSGVIQTATPEEILSLKVPLIENDWGVGLTFYYLYLSALATGSFAEIRKNWQLIKDVYAFFKLMHDWACMGTGYSDNGITWVEGANYGLFTAFIHMAEAVGDHDARAFGIYNAAKQLALRLAILQSSMDYFPAYFETEPWYCTKHFHEEFCPHMAFQNVPPLPPSRWRVEAIYNFTTEGIFPETYWGMRQFGGSGYEKVMSALEQGLVKETPDLKTMQETQRSYASMWHAIQSFIGLMIDKALNPEEFPEDFYAVLNAGREKGFLMEQWRGIHIFSRALPENYMLCQLLAWMQMRKHKLWLEHWEEMEIQTACWTSQTAQISFTHSGHGPMKLHCGVTEIPALVLLNGVRIPVRMVKDGKLEIKPETGGLLEIRFRDT